MASDLATRRLRKELIALKKNPVENIVACPLESNILDWHYCIQGTKGTDYEGLLNFRFIKSVHSCFWDDRWLLSREIGKVMSYTPNNAIIFCTCQTLSAEIPSTIPTQGLTPSSNCTIMKVSYPQPPSVIMFTPNGRFKTGRRLCLSMSGTPFLCFFFFLETSDMMILLSDFHPETWNPMWSGTQFWYIFYCTQRE